MNLLFFTIEVERGAVSDRSDGKRPHEAQTRGRRRLRWIGLGIVAMLCAVAAGYGGWLLAGGHPTGVELRDRVAPGTPSVSAASNDQARLEVSSQPDRAMVLLDGDRRGSTPLVLSVAHGVHTLSLKHSDAIDEQRQVSVAGDTSINVSMWLRRPTAMLLKPAYPGAGIADTAFLEDGRVGARTVAAPVAGAAIRTPELTLRPPLDGDLGSRVIQLAQTWLGVPYVFGGVFTRRCGLQLPGPGRVRRSGDPLAARGGTSSTQQRRSAPRLR